MDLFLHVASVLIGFISLVAVISSQIINKNEIGDSDSFTMTCNLSSFKGVNLPETKFFTRLRMYRKLESKEEELIGMLEAAIMDKSIDPVIKKIPEGRQWEYKFGGQNAVRNLETIFFSLTVKDARRADAGLYWCVGDVHGTSSMYPSTKFNLQPQEQKKSTAMTIGEKTFHLLLCCVLVNYFKL